MAAADDREPVKHDPPRRQIFIGLLSDRGMPTTLSEHLVDQLPGELATRLHHEVDWRVESHTTDLALDEHGDIPMLLLADEYREGHRWDVLVLLTDLPRRAGAQPILSDLNTAGNVALVSVPALGAFHLTRRARGLIVHLLTHLLAEPLDLRPSTAPHRSLGRLSAIRHIHPQTTTSDTHIALTGFRGRLRLLAGMVADNRPWRLVPHLSSATAAAAATAAYGLITTTFWDMADSLSTLRLALISVVAVVAMVIWLLAYNHLWTRAGSRVEKEKMVLYNLSTMVTLSIGVACMYVILYFVTLLGAAVLIDSRYLQSRLGHPVSVADYARLVWLTCSVGIVAGALGSSLESEEAVRQATYSTREQQRHKKNRDQPSQDQDRAR
jgi:hypothetical protein